MDPKIIAVLGLMMICCSSSVGAFFLIPEEKSTGPTGPTGPRGPSGPGPDPLTTPTTDHPLAGEHFLVRAAPFVAGDPLPAIIPDPDNENLVAFDQGETKQDSSKMIFEIVSSKPNLYKLKNKGTGEYWSYSNDGFWEWTTIPGTDHEVFFEYMTMDNGKKMYRLSNFRANAENSLYFGYTFDGKAKASFDPNQIQDGNHLFKVVDS
jgi:hypothetical protein